MFSTSSLLSSLQPLLSSYNRFSSLITTSFVFCCTPRRTLLYWFRFKFRFVKQGAMFLRTNSTPSPRYTLLCYTSVGMWRGCGASVAMRRGCGASVCATLRTCCGQNGWRLGSVSSRRQQWCSLDLKRGAVNQKGKKKIREKRGETTQKRPHVSKLKIG